MVLLRVQVGGGRACLGPLLAVECGRGGVHIPARTLAGLGFRVYGVQSLGFRVQG